MNDHEFAQVLAQIGRLLDLDLECYKPNQVRRRLNVFITRSKAGSVAAFCKALETDAGLLDRLRDTLTIDVTEFFRDPRQWNTLEQTIMPALAEGQEDLKIWSAGCSHGEEPYTVAMLLAKHGWASRRQIEATDFDRRVLEQARQGGPYVGNDLRGVPKLALAKYFEPRDDGHYVTATIRERVRFRELNLLTHPFGKHYDLILCRNVIIYFTDEVKTQLFRRFHAALTPDGVLFIGSTEAILNPAEVGFERIEGNFYRRTAAGAQPLSRSA